VKLLWWLLLLLLEGGGDGEGDPPDDDDDTEDDTDEDEDEEIRDPKALVKSLRSANDRLAAKVAKRDERIRELEQGDGDAEALRSTRLELAFLRAAIEREEPITDLDTAWDLANVRGFLDAVEIEEDGTAPGMAEALDRIAGRYPWLVNDDAEPPDDDTPPGKPSARPVNRQRQRGVEGRAGLEKRFPALRRRRRVRR